MVAGGTAVASVAAVMLAAWIAIAWQRSEAETLREEVAQLSVCGDKRRLCVRVDKSVAYDMDYLVVKGY